MKKRLRGTGMIKDSTQPFLSSGSPDHQWHQALIVDGNYLQLNWFMR